MEFSRILISTYQKEIVADFKFFSDQNKTTFMKLPKKSLFLNFSKITNI